MKKKILFISHNINRGGAQLLLKNVIQSLNKEKFDCHIWSPHAGELIEEYRESGIPVHICDFKADRINRKQKIIFNQALKKRINKIIKECKRKKKKIAIRCAGTITTKLLEEFDFSQIKMVGIFDNNPALWGKEIKGYKVYPTDEIDRFNIDAVLIAHLQPEFLVKEFKSKNIKVYKVFKNTRNNGLLGILSYLFNLLAPILFFAKINPNIVFVNNASNFWAITAAKLLGKKVIWTIHEGFDPRTFRAYPQFLYLSSFKFADKFIFPSKSAYNYYKDFAPKAKSYIIHNGIDLKNVEEYKKSANAENLKAELNIPADHKIICNIGACDEIKGQAYLVKAAIKLLNCSKNYTFIIVGIKNNECSKNLEKLVKESGFEKHFRLIPVLKDVYKFYDVADIYVTSSFNETFGLSNIEAIAFQKPVISTNVGGIPEIITDNIDGILIPTTDMEEHIANKIDYLIKNPAITSKLVESSYKNITENFTIEKMIYNYERTIDNN